MSHPPSAESRVGTILHGKWRLERLLGVGGMAAVYEATHRIGRRDAIKILHSAVARSPDLRARFEQEAHAVNRFAHPGAVEIRDIDTTEDGTPFLVMELLEGEPLSQHVGRPGGLGLDDLLRYCDELLDVLAAAHAQGIIHRDIKPDNLFVLKDGRLKVLDFGIARMRESSAKSSQTLLGTRLGTLPYMPPEQIKGLPIDARADLFAVGAMLFRLITGRRVHEAPTEAELASKMLTEQAPSLASVAPATPAPVGMVVDRALAFDRQQRYPDARSMQQDVRAARAGTTPPVAAQMLAELGPPAAGASAQAPRVMTARVTPSSALADAPTDAASPMAATPGPLEPTGATRMPQPPTTVGQTPLGLPYPAVALAPTSSDAASDVPTAAAGPSAISLTRPTAQATLVSPGAPPATQATAVAPPAVAVTAVPPPTAEAAAVSVTGLSSRSVRRAADEDPRQRLLGILLATAGIGLVVLLLVGWWWAASRSPAEEAADPDSTSAEGSDASADAGRLEPAPGAETTPSSRSPEGTRASATPRLPATPSAASPGSKSLQPGASPTSDPAPTPAPSPSQPSGSKKDKDDKKAKGKGPGHGRGGDHED